ncbi:MAG: hypothetical protein ACKPKO_64120, partial [Candidatus Fonsibacter sp.]
FDTYEDAKFFQLKYGGDITFIKQYEQRSEWRTVTPLDQGVEGAPMTYACEMVPTGKSLFILNLYAEASLTNGFRYIKGLLMQHHNFYLNSSYKLLTNNGIDVYTVKTDAFTIRQSQLETARGRRNWEDGIGNWRLNKTEDIKFPHRRNAHGSRGEPSCSDPRARYAKRRADDPRRVRYRQA